MPVMPAYVWVAQPSMGGGGGFGRSKELGMESALKESRIVVVGRGSGIAKAITLAARACGAEVVVAGRNRDALAMGYDDPGIVAETLDITDDASIEAFAKRIGHCDHVVSTASARAR